MKWKLLVAAVVLAAGAAALAAGKELSEQAKKKVAKIESEVKRRVNKRPLSFEEFCWLEVSRMDRGESISGQDPLPSLYSLKGALRRRIEALNPLWRPKSKPEPVQEVKFVHREYDISDIVMSPPDYPAPNIGFGTGHLLHRGGGHGGGGMGGIIDLGNGEDKSVSGGFGWEKIEELINRILSCDVNEEMEIRFQNGRIIAVVTEEQDIAIKNMLKVLRDACGYQINMEVKFMRTSASYLNKLRGNGPGPAIYLSDKAEKQLLEDAKQKKDVEVVASSEIIAANMQRVHIREGQQRSLLMDYDINTVGIPTLQPVVKLVNEGLICEFKPTVIRDGKAVSLDILVSLSALQKEIRKGEFLGGELYFPAIDLIRIRTGARVPSGTAILVGGTVLTSAGRKDTHEFVVYVKPTINKRGK